MKVLHAAIALALIMSANFILAQTTGTESPEVRDTTKPAPADGAITGGSIRRGAESTTSEEAIKRCNELSGSLREQCLLQEKGAGTGGTREKPEDRKADPRAAPPPQNPR